MAPCGIRFQLPVSLRVVSEARMGKAYARAQCVQVGLPGSGEPSVRREVLEALV
jgi:hypothetical protein